MRSRNARRTLSSLAINVAIAAAWVGAVTFFIVVMEYHIGRGELTAAELSLINATVRTATAPIVNDNNRHN